MGKRGRPKKNVTKSNQLNVRLSDSEIDKLEILSMELDKPKSDILRDAIDLLYRIKTKNY